VVAPQPPLKLVNACDLHRGLPHPMNGAQAADLPVREIARRKDDARRRVVSMMTRHTTGVRGLLVHNERSMSERLRRRRWRLVRELIPDLAELRVLDLGGTGSFWSLAPVQPAHVTVVNLFEAELLDDPCVTSIEGDALRADEMFPGEEFDLVFSNSVIEHLGGHAPRRRFAEVASAMAPRYLVQTPYRYAPVEPHWMFPGFQFLPVAARAYIAPRWPLGHTHGWEPRAATEEVLGIELLSVSEMRAIFPDARIRWERIAGVPKSMIAIR
jgi:Methyltransferase domain